MVSEASASLLANPQDALGRAIIVLCVAWAVWAVVRSLRANARVTRAFRNELPARIGGAIEKRPLTLANRSITSPGITVRFQHGSTIARYVLETGSEYSLQEARLEFELLGRTPIRCTLAATRSRRISGAMLTRLWGNAPEVVDSGSPEFDRRFVVSGDEPSRVRRLLTPALQRELLEIADLHRQLRVALKDTTLTIAVSPWPPTVDEMVAFTEAGKRIYDAFAEAFAAAG